MARVGRPEFDPDKLVVLPHAVERASQRGLVSDPKPAVAREEIKAMVAAALGRGEVHDARPRQFRGSYETTSSGLPFWQRLVVYVDRKRDFEAAFVVDVSHAPTLTVITSYSRLR